MPTTSPTGTVTQSEPPPKPRRRIPLFGLRREYLVDRAGQHRMTRQVLLIVMAGLGLVAFNLHVIDYFSEVLGPTARHDPGLGLYALSLVYIHISLWAAVSAAALYLMCVFFSHRIAGPAYALAKGLRALANGDLAARVRLRKGDHLGEVANELNATARRLRAWHDEMVQATADLRAAARDGEDLDDRLESLGRILGRYRAGDAAPTAEKASATPGNGADRGNAAGSAVTSLAEHPN